MKKKSLVKTENLNIRVTLKVKKQLAYICGRLDRSQAWVVTNLLNEEYEKQKKKETKDD